MNLNSTKIKIKLKKNGLWYWVGEPIQEPSDSSKDITRGYWLHDDEKKGSYFFSNTNETLEETIEKINKNKNRWGNVEEILFKTSNKLYQITRNKYADNLHQQLFFTTIITDIH